MKKILFILGAGLFCLSTTAQQYKGSESTRSVEEQLNNTYCTGIFQSTHGSILDVASNPSAASYINILDWMEGRVAGLQVYKTRSGISVPVLRGQVPGIYIDEIPVQASTLYSLNVNDVAIVKVIRTAFFGGGSNGAIAIYTIGGEEEEDETGDGK